PEARPRATETIKEMIAMIKDLMKKDDGEPHAYETSDGIYFDVSSFKDEKGNRLYGKLSGNVVLEDLEAGARVAVKEAKKHPSDFALWKKAAGENARHLLRWKFETGERVTTVGEDPSAGFPGWHIECSAMSRKHLGGQIDIHTGGEDNIFPHHESEIAQSESCGPAPFATYWIHKRRIDMGEAKMSKSLGNILTVPDIVAKGFSPLDLRYYLLSVHYRTNLKFTWKGMEDAKKARRKIMEWIGEIASKDQGPMTNDQGQTILDVRQCKEEFVKSMDADLNTSAALAAVFDCMAWSRNVKAWSADAQEALRSFTVMVRKTFGCFEREAAEEVPAEVKKLLEERAEARARKDFAASDRLRGEIEGRGFMVKDTQEGQKIVRK
ncbi:MAG: DALR domain-containing protein, partial [Patescibacteria group bacterium]